jgi:hypothetical protein
VLLVTVFNKVRFSILPSEKDFMNFSLPLLEILRMAANTTVSSI